MYRLFLLETELLGLSGNDGDVDVQLRLELIEQIERLRSKTQARM